MATTLYYVQSDTLPQIKITLTNEETESPKNLVNKIVSLHVKPAAGNGVRFSRQADYPNGASDQTAGVCYINWQAGDLNRAPGNYTAEVEVYDTLSNSRETIYETITIVIREDIGDYDYATVVSPNTVSPPIGVNPPTYD